MSNQVRNLADNLFNLLKSVFSPAFGRDKLWPKLIHGTAPNQLVRICFAFDTGKQEAGDKRHIDPFFAGCCIDREVDGHGTTYIGLCRRGFQSL